MHIYSLRPLQSGTLHLSGILGILVVIAVAAIGIKVYNTTRAESIYPGIVKITSAPTKPSITGFQPLVAQVDGERAISKVIFRANGQPIPDIGIDNCYGPAKPMPDFPNRTYAICWNVQGFPEGVYKVTARATFDNGETSTSEAIRLVVLHGGQAVIRIQITEPLKDVKVSGYVPVVATASSEAAKVVFTANGKVIKDAGADKCYPSQAPALPAHTYMTCLDAKDTAYGTSPTLTLGVTAYDLIETAFKSPPVVITRTTAR